MNQEIKNGYRTETIEVEYEEITVEGGPLSQDHLKSKMAEFTTHGWDVIEFGKREISPMEYTENLFLRVRRKK